LGTSGINLIRLSHWIGCLFFFRTWIFFVFLDLVLVFFRNWFWNLDGSELSRFGLLFWTLVFLGFGFGFLGFDFRFGFFSDVGFLYFWILKTQKKKRS